MAQDFAFMMGLSLFILGLSYVLRADDWCVFLDHIQKKARRSSLVIGTFALLTGAIILSFHWIWHSTAMILTLIGLLLLLKGTVYLLYPGWLPAKLLILERHNLKALIRFSGFILMILALIILYGQLAGSLGHDYSFSSFSPPYQKTKITEIAF